MAYRLVYSEFWTDPKVMEEMTPEDKFFYLYILTNPSTTNCGIYMITKKQMAFELGYSIEAINSLMERFEKHHKLITYNKETRELAIKNWGKYNLSRGGKPVLDCLSSELSKVKDKTLIQYVQVNISNQVLSELYQSFYDTSTSRQREDIRQGDNTDTYTVTDTFTSTNTERDTNTEREFVEKNNDINKNNSSENEEVHNLSLTLIQEYEKITGQLGILNVGAVKIVILQHGYNNVKKAINKALEKGKLNMPYVNGILRTWAKEGYPKEGDNNGTRSTYKNNGAGTNEFNGFKPQEPRTLTEEERKAVEGELI